MYPYNYVKPQSFFGNIRNSMRGFSFNSFLDGCQKTLGVVNQALPIVNQLGPIVTNAKTMFKIANIVNAPDEAGQNSTRENSTTNTNKPIFYI